MIAKYLERHDYISLAVTAPQGQKFRLTVSRSGEKVSGNIDISVMKPMLVKFGKRIQSKEGGTIGEKVKAVETLAVNATSIDEFVSAL